MLAVGTELSLPGRAELQKLSFTLLCVNDSLNARARPEHKCNH